MADQEVEETTAITPEKEANEVIDDVLTPRLPRRVAYNGEKTEYSLERNKVKDLTDEAFAIVEKVCGGLVGQKFETVEKGLITRWYCTLCTTPKYCNNLTVCGWGEKPRWKRYAKHLLTSCVVSSLKTKSLEVRAWQETVQFQQFINIALKKDVKVKTL